MIEGALVYILAAAPPNPFMGCGAVIEGGLIATCRHVWRDALAQAPEGAAPLVEFPRAPQEVRRQALALAESCEGEEPLPDLVLLRPAAIPSGTPVLQLAVKEAFEVGGEVLDAFSRAFGKNAPIKRREDGKGHIDLRAAGRMLGMPPQ